MDFRLVHLCGSRRRRGTPLFVVALVACTTLSVLTRPSWAARGFPAGTTGYLELDVRSDYSHIRVRRFNSVRTMVFVRDTGEEALETQVDFAQPHELKFDYLKYMFLSYVFRPQQEKVLIVGLGGGSMVHFLNRYDPQVQIDAVEIDPTVVKIADQYFGVRSGGNVNVVTADGLQFLADTKSTYDVIYMDAFLKPSAGTDTTGAPRHLRTLQFYQSVQDKLKPGGLVVFNLNPHSKVRSDLETIRAAFPQTYVFHLPGSVGLVAVGSTSAERLPQATVTKQAGELDRRFRTNFSFQRMIRNLAK